MANAILPTTTATPVKDKVVTVEGLKVVKDSLQTKVDQKLDKKQDAINAGKFLKVGANGDIEYSDAPSGGGTSTADIEKHNTSNTAHQDIRNELKNKADVSQIPSISGLATKTELGNKADKATTLVGYGITDGATKTELNSKANQTEVNKLKEDLTAHKNSKHFDGNYDNLTNKPAIPDVSGLATKVELSNKADKSAIPTKLPNPQPIKFTGGVVAEYDGSGAVTIQIPNGGNADVERIEKLVTDTNVTLEPNKLYIFPEMASLTYALKAPSKNNVANEYHFVFKSGASATQLVHAVGVNIGSFKVEPNKIYEVSIMENLLTSQSWVVV